MNLRIVLYNVVKCKKKRVFALNDFLSITDMIAKCKILLYTYTNTCMYA